MNKPETQQSAEVVKTLDNKEIGVFDYGNKRLVELSSKLTLNKDALSKLKLAPEASQKVNAMSGQMDQISTTAQDQIKRLLEMQSKPQMDDGNMTFRETPKQAIDGLINGINSQEKTLSQKDTVEGVETINQITSNAKPETGNMKFNDAVNYVETGKMQNSADDKILEQLVNAEKVDYVEGYDVGDEIDLTQMTDINNAGAGVGEAIGGKLLTEIKVGEKMFLSNDEGGTSFEVNEIYNLEDKYVIETDGGFYSIQKTEQSALSPSYPESSFAHVSALNSKATPIENSTTSNQDSNKSSTLETNNKINEVQPKAVMDDGNLAPLNQEPQTARDAMAKFINNEKTTNDKSAEMVEPNVPSIPELPNSEKPPAPTPDLPPIPKAEQRIITPEKPLTWQEAKIEADKRYTEAGKAITEKKNSFLGKTRKVGQWLSQRPGAIAKLGIAGAMYTMAKLSQAEQFISNKYNSAVESAGKSIDKATTKISIFKEGYKSGVNEYRLEKARAKQEKIKSKLDVANEKVNSGEQKATKNAENLLALNKKLQTIRGNNLENKKINV